jgi:hypothetical protein
LRTPGLGAEHAATDQVHHAANAAGVDKNFGAVLIIFDRLLGTFAIMPTDEPIRFSLAGMASSANPVNMLFALQCAGPRAAAAPKRPKAYNRRPFLSPSDREFQRP